MYRADTAAHTIICTVACGPSAEPTPPTAISPGAEKVGAYEVQVPTDLGPREYANGVVRLDSAGTPITYEVASGDVFDFVADRLGIDGNYIATINQVRRGYTTVLFVGDVLNLDPHTITSGAPARASNVAASTDATRPPNSGAIAPTLDWNTNSQSDRRQLKQYRSTTTLRKHEKRAKFTSQHALGEVSNI